MLDEIVLRRQLLTAGTRTRTPDIRLPLRLLWILSRPTDVTFIDPRSSLRPALEALDSLGNLVELEICTPPTLKEVERRLDEARRANRPFHVVHFDGHGTYLPSLGAGALCFEDADAKNQLV